ncbi:MAG TPA: hypothetical protein VGB75_00220 [Jatrophihabitans sp.]|jgi:hypothetical protein|uniref:hypothetical protein n=1 Tax=Jatrophihabitans sp. TaxID=1932789 RepID=UPI002F18A46B
MIKAARRRLDLADDTGATLVLALILITVVALVVGVLLSFGDSSVRTTVALRGQAAAVYGSDGAAAAAITALRRSPFNNNTSSPTHPKCFGAGLTADTLLLNDFYPGTTGGAASSAAVECTADPNTGAAGGLVKINDGNKPGNAILTMGANPGEDGVNIKALSSSFPFRVHGSVVSNSNIRVTNGSLESNVGVYARTGCSGAIVSTPPPACSSGPTADPGYQSEPAFGSPANAVPTYRPVPAVAATNCPGGVMTFQPGYYDDGQALSSLMSNSGGSCKDSVWWFTPGIYYFDFHNSANPLLGGSDVWTVSSGQLVAGTPTNAAGTVLAKPASPSTIPGACQNPIKDENATGVQFIFGGDSQLRLTNDADAEICATYHSDRPPIAVYGAKTGAEALVPTATVKPSTVVNPPAPALFDSATVTASNLAEEADSAGAVWTKTATGNQTASFTLGGYAPAPVIPAGSVLNSATLRVVYKNSAGASGDVRTVVLTPTAGGAAITSTLPSTASTVAQTALINLYSGGVGPLATAVHTYGFTGASMAYSTRLAHTGVETVDALQLDLGYTPPAFRAQDGAIPGGNCLTSTYTGGGGGQCAVLSMSTGYSGRFYIQGTTYTPKAVIDLTLNNITSQVLRFGVVARSLWVKETGSITYNGPVIEVPDNSPGFGPGGTVVYLNVYLCQAASSCTAATGKLSLRARVLIYDPTATPNPPARQITIQSWAVQR